MPAVSQRPSHRVEEHGDHVVIRDLELFIGFDPDLDDPKDTISRFNTGRVQRVVETTGKMIERGQFPQVMLDHNSDDPEAPSNECVGRVLNVREAEIGSAAGIIGDVEMGRPAFDELIATNRFPRRSAEIWSNNHLSEVALLGSKTPARPVRDTVFHRVGSKTRYRFAQPLAGFATPGPGNTFIPGQPPMQPMQQDGTEEEMQKLRAELAKVKAECEALKGKIATAKAAMDEQDEPSEIDVPTSEDEPMPDDKTKTTNEPAKDTKPAAKPEKKDEDKETFARKAEQLQGRVTELEMQLKRERFSRELDAMEQDGYRIPEGQRDEMLGRIVGSQNPDEEVEFFKTICSRVPLRTVVGSIGYARQATELSAEAIEAARERAVREAGSDPVKFKQLFDKYRGAEGAA